MDEAEHAAPTLDVADLAGESGIAMLREAGQWQKADDCEATLAAAATVDEDD